MKKILVAAMRPSGSSIAKKIAEDNPEVVVHLLGPQLKTLLPKNFSWIGEEIRPTELCDRILRIYDSYDFIYANEIELQTNTEFQNWKKTSSIPVFCSSKEISFLEFSKLATKAILRKLHIPNAEYEEIKTDNWGRIIDFVDQYYKKNKFVLKMDRSLVSTGSQSMISSYDQYIKQMSMFEGKSASFFAEKFICGKEFSAHFLCNGTGLIYLGSARDYKKQYENDEGPNTGSTGCYSPVEYVSKLIEKQIVDYANKILAHVCEEGLEYRGIMYLGCLIDQHGQVNVLEINTRCGNPEFCAILPSIESNLLLLFYSAALGQELSDIIFNNRKTVTLNIIHQDYGHFPHTFRDSKQPNIIADRKFTMVMYHSIRIGYNYFASVTRVSDSIETSAKEIMSYLDNCDLGNYRYRKDIGMSND